MTKRVGIAALKAQLSKHLRAVKRGDTITVLDHGTAVAEVIPVRATPTGPQHVVHPAKGRVSDLELPDPPRKRPDVDRHLAAERGDRS